MSRFSKRWCPTPQQLMILNELYTRGLANPNVLQIQNIASNLSVYGDVRGLNVFYWFQNRRARDRQKLRKKLAEQLHQLQHLPYQHTASATFHQFFNRDSAQNVYPQACEGTWRAADVPKESLMTRPCGHEFMIIKDVGRILPCCRNRPLETLDLFPLISPTVKDQENAQA